MPRFAFTLHDVIAHQGGWDEALLVAVPMVLVAWLLWLAKLRVNRAERRVTQPDDEASARHGPIGGPRS